MKTIRRLLQIEVYSAIALTTLAFLALFSFFDFVDQIPSIGRQQAGLSGYQLPQAATFVVLLMPNHLYELLPITALIGTIFVLTRMAQSSEFTILRTSGLGPWRALRTLLSLGTILTILTFLIGDYLAPWADRKAQLLKARYEGNLTVGQSGAWLRERQAYGQYAVNVNALTPDGGMQGVRIFEFDNRGHLITLTRAASAIFEQDSAWHLDQVERTEFGMKDKESHVVSQNRSKELRWPTQITAEMVSAAVLRPDRMSTIALFQYIRHLQANAQSAQRYEIEFWKKVFYPLGCLVMVVLALPFAFLHFRDEGISGYVFGGVLAGISFFFLNNVFGYLGELQQWQPWLAAALPGLIYSLLSLTAFGWLVFKR
ncbi:MAG: LPS export ABC transporter permease LptG [Hylemonella sp.]